MYVPIYMKLILHFSLVNEALSQPSEYTPEQVFTQLPLGKGLPRAPLSGAV